MTDSLFSNSEVFMGNFVDAEDIFGDENPEDVNDNSSEKEETKNPEVETQLPEGEVDAADIFGDESPESVGEDEDNKEDEETTPKGTGSSPKGTNLYSSFAQALYGDGLFKFLDEDTVNGVVDADSFSNAFENEVNARLDDVTKRVKEALDAGVQPSAIARYEKIITNLDNIKESDLTAETQEGSNLRRSIIRQDYLNRGFSPERAEKQVDRIMSSEGTDIDDAKDALESVKAYFKDAYKNLVDEGKAEVEAERKQAEKEAKEFKEALLNKDTLFNDIPIDKATRQKAYDAMVKRVKTTEDGEDLTAVQLYADEHPVEFRVMLGTVYALTDGFTKMGKLLDKSVNKKVKSNLQEIEQRLKGQPQGGSFSYREGGDSDGYGHSTRRKRLDI